MNTDYIERIERLSRDLERLKPISLKDEDRLWKKFRLEWDYNSNHIEGNTLTYKQTELLLMFDHIAGPISVREVEEMRAHDVAIRMVQELALDPERDLTETFIRDLNKAILVESYEKEAVTPSGEPTTKLIEPGNYKKTPNSVRLPSGELFNYVSPEETPIKMGELLEYYREHSAQKSEHPVVLAAMLHYDFVRIHPFDDGNGRVARLIMNFVLLKNSLPPVIIKSADKRAYLNVLRQADAELLNPFVNYIAEQLTWSLELSIRAAKGESIEEPDDLDKEIDVLVKQLNVREDQFTEAKSANTVQLFINGSVFPLLELLETKLSRFDSQYNKPRSRNSQMQLQAGHVGLGNDQIALEEVRRNVIQHLSSVDPLSLVQLDFSYQLRGFKKSTEYPYMFVGITFVFNEFDVAIRINNQHQSQKKFTYDNGIQEVPRVELIKAAIGHLMDQIKTATSLA